MEKNAVFYQIPKGHKKVFNTKKKYQNQIAQISNYFCALKKLTWHQIIIGKRTKS